MVLTKWQKLGDKILPYPYSPLGAHGDRPVCHYVRILSCFYLLIQIL